MKTTRIKHPLMAHGPDARLAYCTFTPSASNGTLPAANIAESHGFLSIVQGSTGIFACNLENKGQAIVPIVSFTHSGSNNQHEVRVLRTSTTGSFDVQHLSSGSLSNVVDSITVMCVVRTGA